MNIREIEIFTRIILIGPLQPMRMQVSFTLVAFLIDGQNIPEHTLIHIVKGTFSIRCTVYSVQCTVQLCYEFKL